MPEPESDLEEERWPDTPPGRLHAMLDAFEVGQAIYVAVKLGVPDRLVAAPRRAEDLAPEVGARPGPLFRVLRLLAGVGVLSQDPEDRFGLTTLGELLVTGREGSLAPRAIFLNEELYRAAGDLLHTVRTGETAFSHVFGAGWMDYLGAHPAANAAFQAAMVARETNWVALTEAYDFHAHRTLVDVGGGHGAVLAALLRATPGLRGVLFDLPHVLAGATDYLRAQGLVDRVRFEAGSLLDAVPPGADLYLEVGVLHLFPDPVVTRALGHLRRAIPAGGTLLLAELVVPPGSGPSPAKQLDVRMLYASGGRERTAVEWRELLAGAGFDLVRIEPTPLAPSLLIARPRADAAGGRPGP